MSAAGGAAGAAMGRVGLPAPVAELASRDWDVVVVGGGHNGLTAAAYLARAGRSVLVLERRDVLGGACTLEQPFDDPGFLISPCAYVVGLLDGRVVRELELEGRGYRVLVCDPQLWCPLPGGGSIAMYRDRARTEAGLREAGVAEDDIRGLHAYDDAFERLRLLLRDGPLGDTWEGASPGREDLERALGDAELAGLLFEDSIVDALDRHVRDEGLRHAMFGQGVIGTWAGPRDPGTASIRLMHHQGDLMGQGSVWGYVVGGMGSISFAIADAATDAGAAIAAGVPVARVLPGEGVELESGDVIRARAVVSNADPQRTLAMLDGQADGSEFGRRAAEWDVRSPVVKVNAGLRRLPRFSARGGGIAHRAMVTVSPGLDAAQDAFEAAKRGEPAVGFAELYFQTAYDPSVAPAGGHTMSVFAQYAPYELAAGDWQSRRDEIGDLVLDAVEAYAPDVRECVAELQVLGPPDIEERIGLTGGHIFQGQALPSQMWERRFAPATDVAGLYLCGAATHPAGSVIALNGRNAAMAVLADLG